MRHTNEFEGEGEGLLSASASETTPELRRRLADARAQLSEVDVHARRLVKERPMAALGVALAVGLLLGRALSRR